MKTFSGDWAFMSNFEPVEVFLDGESFPTTEHAYQAAKTFRAEERQEIREEPRPGRAKRMGREVTLRPDWELVKLAIMEDLQSQKYMRSDTLRMKLVETGDAPIVEGNDWHDNFWGDCSCAKCEEVEGQNHLGKILMGIRAVMIGL